MLPLKKAEIKHYCAKDVNKNEIKKSTFNEK